QRPEADDAVVRFEPRQWQRRAPSSVRAPAVTGERTAQEALQAKGSRGDGELPRPGISTGRVRELLSVARLEPPRGRRDRAALYVDGPVSIRGRVALAGVL